MAQIAPWKRVSPSAMVRRLFVDTNNAPLHAHQIWRVMSHYPQYFPSKKNFRLGVFQRMVRTGEVSEAWAGQVGLRLPAMAMFWGILCHHLYIIFHILI